MLTVINLHSIRIDFIGTESEVLAFLKPKYPAIKLPLITERLKGLTHHWIRETQPEDEVELTKMQEEKT